jgi:8-oxo-dGTP pyrophosphatase MutT (NUDIX family)
VTEEAWREHAVAPTVACRIVRAMPALPASLEAELDGLWAAAQARMGGRLFNGRVFSADAIGRDRIEGHWTEFRRIVAQMDRPGLFDALGVRPLAVGGLILGDGFVVFGRRPEGAVYQPGEWQLPPAGSVDPSAASGEHPDPLRQLYAELEEELGLPAAAVTAPRALAIVEHPGSHVCDLGIALRTHWEAAAIRAAHAAHGNGEYDALELVPPAELETFLARHAGRVTRQAPVFLARAGLLEG